jgi:hypothetical protein
MVCLTWQSPGEEAGIVHHADPTCESLLETWLSSDFVLVGANVAYDMAVIAERYPRLRALIFQAYEEDRVTDVQIRQQLLDIAAGRFPKGAKAKNAYTLETLAKRCADIELQKDAWRLSYDRFLHVPLEQWRQRALEVQAEARVKLAELEARSDANEKELAKTIQGLRDMIASAPEQCLKYPLEDARATLAVYQAQTRHEMYLADQFRQARAYFALHLSSAWGIRTHSAGVEILKRETQAELDECQAELIEAGLVRVDGTRNLKATKARMIEVCAREGIDLADVRTESHDNDDAKCKGPNGALPPGHPECIEHISLDEEACEMTDDPILMRYAELSKLKKVLSNDVKALEKGVMYPIHTRYGLAETGRSTSSKPPLQNWARGRKCKTCKGKGELREAA